MKISLIVACTLQDGGIGFDNNLPWNLPDDKKFFRQLTTSTKNPFLQNALIMGRKTWDSLPSSKPLSFRLNMILSRNESFSLQQQGAIVLHDFAASIDYLKSRKDIENVFIVGGAQIYEQSLPFINGKCYITFIKKHYECDTFIDLQKIMKLFPIKTPIKESEKYDIFMFERINTFNKQYSLGEYQYLNVLKYVLKNGTLQYNTRTKTDTLSKFGIQMRFSLKDNIFPLLTTKRMFWRGIVEELLWFISGNTNSNTLSEKGIHIWDANGSRQFLDERGLVGNEIGDLGPVYGFQWRHFGAQYINSHTNYEGQGIDQLKRAIHTLKTNISDRRIIVTAWNPQDIDKMALPPCHLLYQFYVNSEGELSCQLYQRSADMGLGVPFNIASYSLLTRLIAQVCNLKPGEFIHTIGDAHIYCEHTAAIEEQLQREPYLFPRLIINPLIKDIDEFKLSDFTLEEYMCHPTIPMKMFA